MAIRKLSPKQQRILDFLAGYAREHGYPPSIREIQRACTISSTSVVDYNLRVLQQNGYLRRSPEISRGIELLGQVRDGPGAGRVLVPLVGTIAAGSPVPVPEADSSGAPAELETLDLPERLTGRRQDVFAVRVRGVSMIDALIDDGDIVVLEPPRSVADGDMVAAWLRLEREVTLKHLYDEGERVRLQPANRQMAPIYTPRDNVEVQGRVVAVIRVPEMNL